MADVRAYFLPKSGKWSSNNSCDKARCMGTVGTIPWSRIKPFIDEYEKRPGQALEAAELTNALPQAQTTSLMNFVIWSCLVNDVPAGSYINVAALKEAAVLSDAKVFIILSFLSQSATDHTRLNPNIRYSCGCVSVQSLLFYVDTRPCTGQKGRAIT